MIGKTISHYQITARLGEEGPGVVYQAEDTKAQRTVALLLVPAEATGDDEQRARLLDEIRAAAALSHPNLCSVHEIDEVEGQILLAREHVEGDSLQDKVASGALSIREAVDIAIQVAHGLAVAHENGIVHRGLGPACVQVNPRGRAKITGFGLAATAGPPASSGAATSPESVAYLSPEQVGGGDVDPRTDLWSCGVMLFEMVCGQTPFSGKDEQAIREAILNGESRSLRDFQASFPYELERILGHCLARKPEDRYQTAAELAADLDTLQLGLDEWVQESEAGREIAAARPRKPFPWRGLWRPLFALALVVVVLLLLKPLGCQVPWFNRTGSQFGGAGESGKPSTSAQGSPPVGTREAASGQSGADKVDARETAAGAGDARPPATPSLAVRTLLDQSPDPQNRFLGDGLAAELRRALARMKGLSVAARTSTCGFGAEEIDLREMGRILGVQTVLEGSVRLEGDFADPTSRLQMTVRLVNAVDGYGHWSERFDRQVQDIFFILDEIGQAVLLRLKVPPPPAGESPLKFYSENLAAYGLFLKGDFHWHQATAEGRATGFACWQEAVAIDPALAPAQLGITAHHLSRAYLGEARPAPAFAGARAAIDQALQVDDSLAGAHLGLAAVLFGHDRDWSAAEREFARCFDLGPASAIGQASHAVSLSWLGRTEPARAAARRARELDPLSGLVSTLTARVLADGPDETIRLLEEAIALDPAGWLAHCLLSVALARQGEADAAVAAAARAADLSADASLALTALCGANFLAGNQSAARQQLEKLQERDRQDFVSPTCFAWIDLARGDNDAACRWFEQAVQERDCLVLLGAYGPVPPPADDPRFGALFDRARPR